MATQWFKLEADDLQEFINPQGLPGYFKVGSGPKEVPVAVVDKFLNRHDARVASSVPEKYARCFRRIRGLIAVRYAVGGETSVTLPLTPSGDVQVFKNYPAAFGGGMQQFGFIPTASSRDLEAQYSGTLKPYASRTAADAWSGCTLGEDEDAAVITFPEALEAGDHIVVDFNHDALDQCYELQQCVLELTAADTLRNFPTLSENAADKVSGYETNAVLFLKRLQNDQGFKTGLQFFDRLELVGEEETRISGGVRQVAPGFGQLL
jgi:hypothetical protein